MLEEKDRSCNITSWLLRQLKLHSSSVAVEYKDIKLTYLEIDRLSDAVALHLLDSNIGNHKIIGVYMSRSIDVIISLIAIMKLGCAYLPLDSHYPPERLRFIINDADVKHIITNLDGFANLPDLADRFVLYKADATTEQRLIAHDTDPEDACYIIYTSGSTGRPKGIVMPHFPLYNLMKWQISSFNLKGPARVLQYTSINFDVSFQEIFSTLLQGGQLVLIDDDTRKDSRLLLQHVIDNRIERLFLPFVILQELSSEVNCSDIKPHKLREIITAGEQLKSSASLREMFQNLPQCRLINQYGPSETHAVTSYALPLDPDLWPDLPPIGFAIPGAEIFVVDDEGQLVGKGEPGELYIGGVVISSGYLNNYSLTSERFFEFKISNSRASKVYKTGDIVIERDDGCIDFVGRRDHQVKIRGNRVELGEIESILLQIPGIKDAVAIAHKNSFEEMDIYCFIVLTRENSLNVDDIFIILSNQLSEYMIPKIIKFIDTLPLTPSGKVDRRALDISESSKASDINTVSNYEKLKTIWQAVIGRIPSDHIQSFYSLGGDSLQAARIAARIRREFQVEYYTKDVFKYFNFADAVSSIEELQKLDKAHIENANFTRESENEEDVSYGQESIWLAQQIYPKSPMYNINFGLTGPNSLDSDRLKDAFRIILDRHPILRSVFTNSNGRLSIRQIDSEDAVNECFSIHSISHTGSSASRIDKYIKLLGVKTFNLESEPPIRLTLIRTSSKDLLVFNIHHIAFDGASIDFLLQEIEMAYNRLKNERRGGFTDRPTISRVRTETSSENIDYWIKQLQQQPNIYILGDQNEGEEANRFRGRTLISSLECEIFSIINELKKHYNATSFAILSSIIQAALSKVSGYTDFILGVSSGARHDVDHEPQIGFFVETFLLKSHLELDISFKELVESTMNQIVIGASNVGVRYDELASQSRIKRKYGYNPLFQICLVMEHPRRQNLQLSNNKFDYFDIDNGTAKYDLTIFIETMPDIITIKYEYNTQRISNDIIEELSNTVLRIVSFVGKDPNIMLRGLLITA